MDNELIDSTPIPVALTFEQVKLIRAMCTYMGSPLFPPFGDLANALDGAEQEAIENYGRGWDFSILWENSVICAKIYGGHPCGCRECSSTE